MATVHVTATPSDYASGETNDMTTSGIIATLDVVGLLCIVGAIALAVVVVTELWRRARNWWNS